jgi:hypothetical protein
MEATDSRVSGDNLDVDSEAGPVFDDGVFEAGADPAFGDGRVSLLGLVEEACIRGAGGFRSGAFRMFLHLFRTSPSDHLW